MPVACVLQSALHVGFLAELGSGNTAIVMDSAEVWQALFWSLLNLCLTLLSVWLAWQAGVCSVVAIGLIQRFTSFPSAASGQFRLR
ncbi:MAG: hypothetical protein CMM01_01650 [Rhodopirellula sp.]|nr:hypothetical protein [Rhodopirellula sp.]OUX52411.1 MAG: hypothetical protein CBE43_00805 [Rhodopirellula sp. TMED283]